MKELSKELTPELLSLVLDREIDSVKIVELFPNQIVYEVYEHATLLNIDTLTRLMKEWCYESKYSVMTYMNVNRTWSANIRNYIYCEDWNCVENDSNTEFEAVLKATAWTAKERGLV